VLLSQANQLTNAEAFAKSVLSEAFFHEIIRLIPNEWLQWNDVELSPDDIRDIYFNFLNTRLQHSENFLNTATNARK
jgi:hypothetical protein